jgi:hypothetical protein
MDLLVACQPTAAKVAVVVVVVQHKLVLQVLVQVAPDLVAVLAEQVAKASLTRCVQNPQLSMDQAVVDKVAGQMVSAEQTQVTEAERTRQEELALTVSTKRAVAAVLAGVLES